MRLTRRGVGGLAARLRGGAGAAAILMYHRVAEVESDVWGLVVEPTLFSEHLEIVQRRYRPISLLTLVESLGRGSAPRRAITVTFDDGYRDNLQVAKPVLERYEVPATVFAVTGYLDAKRDFWWDELEEICASEHLPEQGALEVGDVRVAWNDERLDALCWSLRDQLKLVSEEARLALLDSLRERAGLPPAEGRKILTADELVELAAGGLVDVGAHTVTHPSLPGLARDRQLNEIQSSRAHLEALLARPVETFSYPYGDLDMLTLDCARESGFACAVTAASKRLVWPADPLTLPRFYVGNWTGAEFDARIARLLQGIEASG